MSKTLKKQDSYKKIIKKKLYFGGPLSCTELSLLTNKSVPLVAKTIAVLKDEGKITETTLSQSTGGRPAQKYTLRKDLMFVMAVAVDQLVTSIALVDMGNHYHGPVKKYNLDLKKDEKSLESLGEHLQTFLKESGVDNEDIAGIGIGMPGFIDFNKGINHTYLKSDNGSVTKYLECITGLPVLIDNDSSLIALAELKFGVARNRQNVMVINIGWGIGLGMVLEGKLYRGDSGFAGEFSHIPMFTNNKLCACGKMGCLETEASLQVVCEKAVQGLTSGRQSAIAKIDLDYPEECTRRIIGAAKNGDKFAIDLISEAGYHIGRGIAILVHLLNPQMVVLSGRGAQAGKLWITPIQQALNENTIPKLSEHLDIAISSLGDQGELIGAAALVMEHLDELAIPVSNKSGDVKNLKKLIA